MRQTLASHPSAAISAWLNHPPHKVFDKSGVCRNTGPMLQRNISSIHALVAHAPSVQGLTVGVVAMVQQTTTLMRSGVRT